MTSYKLTVWTKLGVFIRILLYSFTIAVCLLLVGLAVFDDYYQGGFKLIALLAISAMSGLIIYRMGPVILLLVQYYRNDSSRTVSLDPIQSRILIQTRTQTVEISRHNLRRIEYHSFHAIPNRRTSGFEFVKFTLADQSQWFITHLTVEPNLIRELFAGADFSGVESVYKFSNLNWLN